MRSLTGLEEAEGSLWFGCSICTIGVVGSGLLSFAIPSRGANIPSPVLTTGTTTPAPELQNYFT